MIICKDKLLLLNTNKTSYAIKLRDDGGLEHLHYGGHISTPLEGEDTLRAMEEKISHGKGMTIAYAKGSDFTMDDALLERSSEGKGDFREPSIIVEYADGSRTSDFKYESFEILDAPEYSKCYPNAIASSDETPMQLKITLSESVHNDIKLIEYYTVFEGADCITRRAVLVNNSNAPVKIHKFMSMMLDIDETGLNYTTFGGSWAREMDKSTVNVTHARVVNSSNTGITSNRSNPFVMLTHEDTTETSGEGYGFNLIYSGNHYESVEASAFYKTRFQSGINPETFEWLLNEGESFETPEAVMTFSSKGFEGISHNMHRFVRNHIVRGKFKDKVRPVLINSWEASYFKISESKLLTLAGKAKEAGIELFVMDDGWFKGRNDDHSSLGDWTPDSSKLPNGVEGLAAKVHKLGLDFGIWVEPEMVNEDSDLYRAHPEYALSIPGREQSLGRNQMVLDLTNPEVSEYIKNAMRNVFKTPGVNYVKWDMNRLFSDVYAKALSGEHQGETYHRYVLALYDICNSLMSEFPDILFEGCSSGGARFDLGILCYFPQIWGSDDSDARERTIIQTGYSYGYPMSTIGAHVSACPNHQTLRNTPIDTRFNVASFGVLGYELNLSELSKEDFERVKAQVAIYKEWREVFFKGEFYRVGKDEWVVVSPDRKKAVAMIWNELVRPNDFYRKLRVRGLDDDKLYHIYNIQLKHNLKEFGSLVNQVAPIHIKQDSLLHNTIARFVKMDGEVEDYLIKGEVLNNAGIKLTQAFGGTGYNGETRLFQDFASRLYFIESVE